MYSIIPLDRNCQTRLKVNPNYRLFGGNIQKIK